MIPKHADMQPCIHASMQLPLEEYIKKNTEIDLF